MLGHEGQGQSIAAGGSTVRGSVGGTLESAVLGTVGVTGADGSPVVAIIAVLIAADFRTMSAAVNYDITSWIASIPAEDVHLPPWTQRQLASMTTSALTDEQVPLVQSDQVRAGWFSAVSVPTCWALAAARRLRNAMV